MAGQAGSARDTGWVCQTDSVGGALTEEKGIEPSSVDPRCVPVTLNPFDMNGHCTVIRSLFPPCPRPGNGIPAASLLSLPFPPHLPPRPV